MFAALWKWHTSQQNTSYCVQHLPWRTAQMSIAISWWCSPVLTALWVGRHGTGARTPHWWNSPVHYSVISGQMDQCYYTNNTSSLDNIYMGNTNQIVQIYPIKSSGCQKTNWNQSQLRHSKVVISVIIVIGWHHLKIVYICIDLICKPPTWPCQ